MIKNVAIVSLSRGIIGESFVKFETDIGIKRLKDFGLDGPWGRGQWAIIEKNFGECIQEQGRENALVLCI